MLANRSLKNSKSSVLKIMRVKQLCTPYLFITEKYFLFINLMRNGEAQYIKILNQSAIRKLNIELFAILSEARI